MPVNPLFGKAPEFSPDGFDHIDFGDAPFVEAGGPPAQVHPLRQAMGPIIDPGVEQEPGSMATWQKILSQLSIIQRLERKPSAQDILDMIQAAEEVRKLSDDLVKEAKEHRNNLLRALGVTPPTEE